MELSINIAALITLTTIIATSLLVIRSNRRARISNVSAKLELKAADLDLYRSYTEYLPRGQRRDDQTSVEELTRDLGSPFNLLVGKEHSKMANRGFLLAEEITNFLENYSLEYVRINIERHREFFQGKRLDEQQKEAIVKDDKFTIVNAAAGSGKTCVLLNRLLYLVKCRRISLDRILMLTFTKSAKDELQRRLLRSGIDSDNIHTFHGFGLKLLKDSQHRKRYAVDKEIVPSRIKQIIEALSMQDKSFANSLLEYPVELSKEEFDAIRLDDPNFLQYLGRESREKRRYKTLDGVPVRSIAERDIANFLCRNQVRFTYGYVPPWPDPDPHYRPYEADFYLPGNDLYLEHWGIDKEGNVAAHFNVSSAGYRKRMKWKRDQFKKHKKSLVETFYYESVDGTLISNLERQLRAHGVILNELSIEQLKQKIMRDLVQQPLIGLMERFIADARMQGLKPDDIRRILSNGNWSRNVRQFASLVLLVWEGYEVWLDETRKADFADMINLGIEVMQKNRGLVAGKYDYVLVDEYQDVTEKQIEFIRCLLVDGKTRLFCVGDTSQSIFSYAGSNVKNILEFSAIFPNPEEIEIQTNYRCPKTIVEAAELVISKNKTRMVRNIRAHSNLSSPIILHEVEASRPNYPFMQSSYARDLIEQIVLNEPERSILVLSRYQRAISKLQREIYGHDGSEIRFSTIHAAKGTEADYVILLGCIRDKEYGFPSEITDLQVLALARTSQPSEADRLEEERRLFYVALTRCRKELHVFTSKHYRSQFVDLIEPYVSKATSNNSKEFPKMPINAWQ